MIKNIVQNKLLFLLRSCPKKNSVQFLKLWCRSPWIQLWLEKRKRVTNEWNEWSTIKRNRIMNKWQIERLKYIKKKQSNRRIERTKCIKKKQNYTKTKRAPGSYSSDDGNNKSRLVITIGVQLLTPKKLKIFEKVILSKYLT